jgi:hypothetical protein
MGGFLTSESDGAMEERISRRRATMEGKMTPRETALRDAGIDVYSLSEFGRVEFTTETSSLTAFSGYGEFTPITVRSDTVMVNADLERNKQRD